MDKFGAELHRHGQRVGVQRPNATADAIARLENGDIDAILRETLRGGEASGTRTYDNNRHVG